MCEPWERGEDGEVELATLVDWEAAADRDSSEAFLRLWFAIGKHEEFGEDIQLRLTSAQVKGLRITLQRLENQITQGWKSPDSTGAALPDFNAGD